MLFADVSIIPSEMGKVKGKETSQTNIAPVHKKNMRDMKNLEVEKIINKSNMAADSNDKSKIFDPKNSQAVLTAGRKIKKKNKKKSINKYQKVQDQEISSTTTVIKEKKVSRPMVYWYFRGPCLFTCLYILFFPFSPAHTPLPPAFSPFTPPIYVSCCSYGCVVS